MINNSVVQRDQLRAAPEMRELFLEQAGREGQRSTAFGPRWGR
jgi:hypothetical protein